MPPLLSGDFAYVESGLALLPPGVLEIDEEAVSDAKNFHVVPQLLLFGRPELPAHGFQFHDHLLAAAAHQQIGIALAGIMVFVFKLDDFLAFVGDFGKAQANLHGAVVYVFGEPGAERSIDVPGDLLDFFEMDFG